MFDDDIPETEVPVEAKITSVGNASGARIPTKGLPPSVEFVRDRKDRGKPTAWVQVSTVNRSWKRAGKNVTYIEPGNKGGSQAKRTRIMKGLKAQKKVASLKMSTVKLNDDGNIEFVDGRHRFALLRDLGVTQVPVVLDESDATEFARSFGIERKGPLKVSLRKVSRR
jgi:hypothetical protein